MTTCLTDQGNFLCISGCIIAVVAYLTPCLSHRTFWLKTLLGLLLSQEAYAILAAVSPDIWASSLLASLGTVGGMFLIFALAMRSATDIVLLGAVLLLLGPWVVHQVGTLTDFLRAHVSDSIPPWFGIVLFAAIVLSAIALVWLFRLTKLLLSIVFVVVGSVVLFVYVRMAVIEAETASTLLCCDFGSVQQHGFWNTAQQQQPTTDATDNSLCPLDVSSIQSAMILVGLLIFSTAQVCWYQSATKASNKHAKPPGPARYTKVQREL